VPELRQRVDRKAAERAGASVGEWLVAAGDVELPAAVSWAVWDRLLPVAGVIRRAAGVSRLMGVRSP
jgi:hypothetical protein